MVVAPLAYSASIANDIPGSDPNNIGVFLMPVADNDVMNVNPGRPTMFIYSQSPNVDKAKQFFTWLTQPEQLQAFIDNSPNVLTLPFKSVESTKFTPEQQAFMDAYKDKRGTVYQTAVNYVNPQWMDIGKDITAMFTGAMTPSRCSRASTNAATTSQGRRAIRPGSKHTRPRPGRAPGLGTTLTRSSRRLRAQGFSASRPGRLSFAGNGDCDMSSATPISDNVAQPRPRLASARSGSLLRWTLGLFFGGRYPIYFALPAIACTPSFSLSRASQVSATRSPTGARTRTK